MKPTNLCGALAAVLALATCLSLPAAAQDAAAAGGEEACQTLQEANPGLGTSQSVSASKEFVTVWGSFELPGGPCGYASAEEHYNALLAETEAKGGPTQHTLETLPDWSGTWGTENDTGEVAIVGRNSTREGLAARLKPEAREVFMRDSQMWLDDHAIDPISFCLQPNFPRWFTEYGYREQFLRPDRTTLYSQMVNQLRHVYTDGRPHPSPEWITPEWLGYSIGFWDEDVLTIWTKGIKEGILQRNMPRQSDQMETIERWRLVDMEGSAVKPNTLGAEFDPNARIEIELTMYDPGFIQPWHTVVAYYKELEDTPENQEQNWIQSWDCVEGSNWYMTEEGVISQYAPGQKPPITDPDYWFNESYKHQ
jgi:hypothetical protein